MQKTKCDGKEVRRIYTIRSYTYLLPLLHPTLFPSYSPGPSSSCSPMHVSADPPLMLFYCVLILLFPLLFFRPHPLIYHYIVLLLLLFCIFFSYTSMHCVLILPNFLLFLTCSFVFSFISLFFTSIFKLLMLLFRIFFSYSPLQCVLILVNFLVIFGFPL